MNKLRRVAAAVAAVGLAICSSAQDQQPAPVSQFKDELRLPWTRGGTDYIRDWLVAGPITCKLADDCLAGEAATAARAAVANQELQLADGNKSKWRENRTWGDVGGIGGEGSPANAVGYAFATIKRETAGKALLALGTANGARVWVNGKPVFTSDGPRPWAADGDLIDVDLQAGDNTLLIKVSADATFSARVLESGTVLARVQEIAPSLQEEAGNLRLRTDATDTRAHADPVSVEILRAGGEVVHRATGKRGERLTIDTSAWPAGAYEARFATRSALGLRFTAHLPWYKGDALAKARELAAEAAKADAGKPEGFTLQMLANMVDDRLGMKVAEATGSQWALIHSPLMEYEELLLERQGKVGRVRAHGFVRLAWRDDTDDTPQYCRAYLPGGYDPAKKWPLVLQLHGYNPANPQYWDWWSADSRHGGPNTEFAGASPGVIYIEPHGRGNTQYIAFGDADVLRCIAEARKLFRIDEDRTYLTGDSMGGWGTWNVATRHPELFAAIAPIFGGVDYHSTMAEEVARGLTPAERFINEKSSSWGMADSLVNTPVFVHHGDADAAVNVEWSRWGVRLMQRWGYDIRYREYPGKIHEALQINNGQMNIDWFLGHVRNPDPRKVRIRSGELRNAAAWWIRVRQSANPLEFMRVDAEVVDHNVIRLDTDNVLDVVLTPSGKLIDASRPVRVVWNGVAREMRVSDGGLRLTHPGYKPAALSKTPQLPGATADFFNTPFAVVVGTSSRDAAMNTLLESKARGFVGAWEEWQKFKPRMFKDTEITDAEIARYSLLLIGGADSNAVSAKLASRLPLKIAPDRVVIDGKSFAAKDPAVQMLYPHPRNAQRYVWLFTGTSAAGMQHAAPLPMRVGVWDFIIEDGRIPARGQRLAMERMNVVAGSFDHNWRLNEAYLQLGDAQSRAQGRVLARPGKAVKLPQAVLDSYAGSYEMQPGRKVVVSRSGDHLLVNAGQEELVFVPLDQTSFYGAKFNLWVTFEKDAEGKVTGFNGYQPGDGEFEAKRQ